jgi:flagellar biosynthesis protein FlhF
MKIKRYIAADMRQALRLVREEQGPDAVILSTRNVGDELELIAAVDYDETLIEYAVGKKVAQQTAGRQAGASAEQAASRVDEELPLEPEDDRVSLSGSMAAVKDTRTDNRAAPTGRRVDSSPSLQKANTVAQVLPEAPAQSPEDSAVRGLPESSLVSMRREISVLKRMLETQMSSLAWNDMSRRDPVRAAVLRDLIRMGLAPDLAQELAERAPVRNGEGAATWRGALGLLSRKLKFPQNDPLAAGGVVALVGPTGVGKTTTIAKLAARYALRNGLENVALISADDYRIGAQEQLFIYGRQLNVPVYVARNGEELRQRIEHLRHADLVLVDTAGVSQRDTRLVRALESLDLDDRPLSAWLVLAANAQMESLDEAVGAFSRVPLAGSIITKLDEAASLGGVLTVLARHGLPITWTADGQEVPENLRRASARHLIGQAVKLARQAPRRVADEALARHINEVRFANA